MKKPIRSMQRPMDFEDRVVIGLSAVMLNLFALAEFMGFLK